MSDTSNAVDDPVIEAVRNLNKGYNNRNYAKRSAQNFGSGTIYTVTFRGENNKFYEQYVFERGQERRAYQELAALIFDGNNKLIPSMLNPDMIKLIVVSVLTIMFAAAVIYMVFKDPDITNHCRY
jgi:hypothetical protein